MLPSPDTVQSTHIVDAFSMPETPLQCKPIPTKADRYLFPLSGPTPDVLPSSHDCCSMCVGKL